jgi:beta-lactamase regulating signal transducer with metallopeptidase domain
METFLTYLLKVSGCLAIFYLGFLLLFKRDINFKFQRLFLLTAVFTSLLLAFNTFSFRAVQKDYTPRNAVSEIQPENSKTPSKATSLKLPSQNLQTTNKSININLILLWIYLTISLLLILRLLAGFSNLFLMVVSSKKAVIGDTTVRITNKIEGSTAIFGLIFLNPSLQQNTGIQKILIHEKIHVSQRHSLDILVIELLAAAMWFNPVVWLLKRSLQQIHEYLADEGVINSGINKLEYQVLLFNQIAEDTLLFSSGFQSSIKKRISMMTQLNKTKYPKLKLGALIPLTLALIVGMSFVNTPSRGSSTNNTSTSFQEDPAKKTKTDSQTQKTKINDKSKPSKISDKTLTLQDPPVAAVALTRMNVLYIGVDNPVTIAVSNYKSSGIKVTIDNGSILKNSDNSYTIRPSMAGIAQLTVFAGDKFISKQAYRVKRVPDPVAMVGGKKGGQISKEDLIKAGGMAVVLENFDFDMVFKVSKFELSTTINGSVIKESSNSNLLTSSQIAKINELSSGQKIYFENIYCVGADGAERLLSPVMFEIK